MKSRTDCQDAPRARERERKRLIYARIQCIRLFDCAFPSWMDRGVTIKGTVHRFYTGGPRNRRQLRNTVYFNRFILDPCGQPLLLISWCHRSVQSRITGTASDHFGPIHDNIISTIAAGEIEKTKDS